MEQFTVTPNIDLNPWTDLVVDEALNIAGETAKIERIGLLPNGTTSGRATVMMLVRLLTGVLVVETTLRLFRMGAAAVLASPVAELDEL